MVRGSEGDVAARVEREGTKKKGNSNRQLLRKARCIFCMRWKEESSCLDFSARFGLDVNSPHPVRSVEDPVSTIDHGCHFLVWVLGVTRCIGGLPDVSASTCRRRFGIDIPVHQIGSVCSSRQMIV